MRKVNFCFLASCALVLAACGGMNKMAKMADQVQIDPSPKVLEMHGDSVEVEIKFTIPQKFFQKAATLEVTPVLKYEGGEKLSKVRKFRLTTRFARLRMVEHSLFRSRKSPLKRACAKPSSLFAQRLQ